VAGFEEVVVRLRAMQATAPVAAAAAANAMAALMTAETMKTLGTSSHEKGTPTPSSPGEPPSLISGALRRSVTLVPAVPVGAAATWMAEVYPTAVYARIQELGGQAGRGHHSTLPPRPYMAPTLTRIRPLLSAAAVAAAAPILGG
jgi:phage gpG-like protein